MRRDVVEHGYGRTLIERHALPSRQGPGRARGPGVGLVLPALPHDAVERATVVENIAVEIVRQLGPVVALTVAAAIDEVAADAAAE